MDLTPGQIEQMHRIAEQGLDVLVTQGGRASGWPEQRLGRFGRVLTVPTCPDIPELDVGENEGDDEGEERDWRSPLGSYRLG